MPAPSSFLPNAQKNGDAAQDLSRRRREKYLGEQRAISEVDEAHANRRSTVAVRLGAGMRDGFRWDRRPPEPLVVREELLRVGTGTAAGSCGEKVIITWGSQGRVPICHLAGSRVGMGSGAGQRSNPVNNSRD